MKLTKKVRKEDIDRLNMAVTSLYETQQIMISHLQELDGRLAKTDEKLNELMGIEPEEVNFAETPDDIAESNDALEVGDLFINEQTDRSWKWNGKKWKEIVADDEEFETYED